MWPELEILARIERSSSTRAGHSGRPSATRRRSSLKAICNLTISSFLGTENPRRMRAGSSAGEQRLSVAGDGAEDFGAFEEGVVIAGEVAEVFLAEAPIAEDAAFFLEEGGVDAGAFCRGDGDAVPAACGVGPSAVEEAAL